MCDGVFDCPMGEDEQQCSEEALSFALNPHTRTHTHTRSVAMFIPVLQWSLHWTGDGVQWQSGLPSRG